MNLPFPALRRPLLVIASLGLASVSYVGVRALADQRAAERDLRARIAEATTELAALHREHADLAHELELAQAERHSLEQAASAARALGADTPHDTTAAEWLARVKRLQQAFADHPEQRIPELELLTPLEWHEAGRAARFDSDDDLRRSLAAVRTAAKQKFGRQLAAALEKFKLAHAGQAPRSPQALAPYFDTPIDPALLDRYDVPAPATTPSGRGQGAALLEKAPVDPDYDARLSVTTHGSWSSETAPAAWIDGLQERQIRAQRDYARAHYGAMAEGVEALAPYFNPPLDEATLARLQKAERERPR